MKAARGVSLLACCPLISINGIGPDA
uniref:Uncharacterized protein n=1 Tax=Anguilla anguilla TaxID=7936 RepID=A0A0E9SP73_ANGAN